MVRPPGHGLPADTAGREEEPVHEDTRAVIVRIIGQQSVPFVLLLTDTVATAPWGGGFAERNSRNYFSSQAPVEAKELN